MTSFLVIVLTCKARIVLVIIDCIFLTRWDVSSNPGNWDFSSLKNKNKNKNKIKNAQEVEND